MAINSAIDLLSKAKLDIPACSEESRMAGAMDCSDLYKRGFNSSGVYPIWPINRLSRNRRLDVYCDMSEGGGWTVIDRESPYGHFMHYFEKDWVAYKNGFGEVDSENFYIGNDNTFMLTNQREYIARIYHRYTKSKKYFTADCVFWIDDEFNNYTLHVSNCIGSLSVPTHFQPDPGHHEEDEWEKFNNFQNKLVKYRRLKPNLGKREWGNLWSEMRNSKQSNGTLKLNEMKFSTKDKDNDPVSCMNCAENRKYGFWFFDCKPYEMTDLTRIVVAQTGIKIRPSSYLKSERQVMS